MTDHTQPDAPQIAREIRAGLSKVTQGTWAIFAEEDGGIMLAKVRYEDGGVYREVYIGVCDSGQQNDTANAAHLARCSPDRIAVLLNALDAQTREIAELREALSAENEACAALVENFGPRHNSTLDRLLYSLGATDLVKDHDQAIAAAIRARSALRAKEKSNG